VQDQADQLTDWVRQRFFWANVLTDLRRVMTQAEAARKEATGIDHGVWIESLTSKTPGLTDAPQQAEEEQPQPFIYNRLMLERYGLVPKGPQTEGGETPVLPGTAPAKTTPASTNELSEVTMKCRAVNLKRHSPTANADLAFAVERQLQDGPLFDKKDTKLSGPIENVGENDLMFNFEVTIKFKNPIKF
jgi:hypothetical protein